MTGTPPFGYRSRKGSGTYAGFDIGTSVLEIVNAQPSDSATYTAVVTNIANLSPGILSAQAVVLVLADADADGMADDWERLHGLDPSNPDDALLDNDGDGMNNRDEYIAGTDPNDPESFLKLEAAGTTEAGNAILRFKAVATKSYTIQARDALGEGEWIRILDVESSSTNRVMEITDPNAHPNGRYYRLVTPKQ
jgi:hypothetical protein